MTPPTADARALFEAILQNPEDDTVRLVYADYLEEVGNEAVECVECKGVGNKNTYQNRVTPYRFSDKRILESITTCSRCSGTGRIIDHTNTAHAALIRDGIENGGYSQSLGRTGEAATARDGTVALAPAFSGVGFTVRRGFVDEIACTLQRFVELFGQTATEKELLRSVYPWPLTRISITGRSSLNGTGGWQWELDVDGDRWDYPGYDNYMPRLLFERLSGKWKNASGVRGAFKGYATEQNAIDALSCACVSWFREVCGFSSGALR